jgi:hypothetical protein
MRGAGRDISVLKSNASFLHFPTFSRGVSELKSGLGSGIYNFGKARVL